MADDVRYPHLLLERYLADRLGRRADLYGAFADDLFVPLVRAVSDQLSIYVDVRPYARLRVGTPTVREGGVRAYVLLPITDRGGPLRLQGAFEHWSIDLVSDRARDFVTAVNGRRWRFVDRHLSAFVEPMLFAVADALGTYYRRRPHAKLKAGLIRFLEAVDATWLACEMDNREEESTKDRPARYEVQ